MEVLFEILDTRRAVFGGFSQLAETPVAGRLPLTNASRRNTVNAVRSSHKIAIKFCLNTKLQLSSA